MSPMRPGVVYCDTTACADLASLRLLFPSLTLGHYCRPCAVSIWRRRRAAGAEGVAGWSLSLVDDRVWSQTELVPVAS